MARGPGSWFVHLDLKKPVESQNFGDKESYLLASVPLVDNLLSPPSPNNLVVRVMIPQYKCRVFRDDSYQSEVRLNCASGVQNFHPTDLQASNFSSSTLRETAFRQMRSHHIPFASRNYVQS
jgi:hypothetical protein